MAVNFQSGITGLFYDPFVYYISLSSRNTSLSILSIPDKYNLICSLICSISHTVGRNHESRSYFVQILGTDTDSIPSVLRRKAVTVYGRIRHVIHMAVYGYGPYDYGP